MRKNCSPLAALIGAAIMVIMLNLALSADLAGRTVRLGIQNKVQAVQMVAEQQEVDHVRECDNSQVE